MSDALNDISLGDLLPFVGDRRVDEALDELYNLKHLTSVLFGVFVGGLVTSLLTYFSPNLLVMAFGWLVLLVLLTLFNVYRHKLTNGSK